VSGFTSSVPVRELARLGPGVVVDIGSGLLRAHRLLPDEPDAASALREGAWLVTASGDKLLGGPQAGLLLGRQAVVDALRRHPLARALRVDKLTLAALEATIAGPPTPTAQALDRDAGELRARADRLAAAACRAGLDADAVASDGVVGGGGAPGVVLESAALAVAAELARPLRVGDPPVVGRVEAARLLLDLRCIRPEDDDTLLAALLRAASGLDEPGARPACT
jgi:L-seryl-tRNA(Ser) seleniumtransferase